MLYTGIQPCVFHCHTHVIHEGSSYMPDIHTYRTLFSTSDVIHSRVKHDLVGTTNVNLITLHYHYMISLNTCMQPYSFIT